MRFRRLWPLGLLALVLATTGCNGGRKNPPDAVVTVLNATANFPPLTFWRGPIRLNPIDQPLQVDFLGGQRATWDEDTYNFHVSYLDLQSQSAVEVDNFAKQVVTGTSYTFVLYQKAGTVKHAILESPPLALTATDAQVQAIHASEGVPSVDFYLVPEGTDVTGTTPWATLAFEATLPPRHVAVGDYEVVATEVGNPTQVLYMSTGFTLSAGAEVTFAVTPDSGEGIQRFSVTALTDSSAVLVDPSLPAKLRVINGATDRQPRDVAVNNEFTPPLFSGTAFVMPTPYLPVTAGIDVPVTVTPAGNPGVLEVTSAFSPQSGSAYTALFAGPTGGLVLYTPLDDLRRVKSQAKLNFYDVAGSCEVCDLLMVTPGTDPNTIPAYDPFTGLDPHPYVTPGSIQPVVQWPGDFDVIVRIQGTQTIVSGPTRITLKDAGLYGIILSDNLNGTTIDTTLIDDFQ
jgi:hypothetical protein